TVDNCLDPSRTADVAIRRPQNFKPAESDLVSWALRPAGGGAPLQWGFATVGADELVTIPGLTLFPDPTRLRLDVLAPVTVTGKVTLKGVVNSQQPITFTFRPVGGGDAVVRETTLGSDGSFTLNNVPAWRWDVAVKGSKWLQKVIPNADMSGGDISGVMVALL